MSGTCKKHLCGLLNTFRASERLWKALFWLFGRFSVSFQTHVVSCPHDTHRQNRTWYFDLHGFRGYFEAKNSAFWYKDTENLPKSQNSAFQRRSEALNVFKRPQRCFLHVPDILETFERKKFSSHFDLQNWLFWRREISKFCRYGTKNSHSPRFRGL